MILPITTFPMDQDTPENWKPLPLDARTGANPTLVKAEARPVQKAAGAAGDPEPFALSSDGTPQIFRQSTDRPARAINLSMSVTANNAVSCSMVNHLERPIINGQTPGFFREPNTGVHEATTRMEALHLEGSGVEDALTRGGDEMGVDDAEDRHARALFDAEQRTTWEANESGRAHA